MTVGAIGPVGGGQSVYAALSPYLNGVARTSNAARADQVDAAAQRTDPAVAQTAIAANGNASAAATAAPPFANPAISDIASRIALGQSLISPAGSTPDALLSSVLTGDGGTLIQANAAALFASSLIPLQASAFTQAIAPAIPPPAIVTAAPRVTAIA
jgi:hypothetical protein